MVANFSWNHGSTLDIQAIPGAPLISKIVPSAIDHSEIISIQK